MNLIVVGQPTSPTPDSPGGGGRLFEQAVTASSFQVTLIGSDGSVWDLTNGPEAWLNPGPQVFAAPDVTHWWQTSPVVDGSSWDGMRTPSRQIVLPIETCGTDALSWRDNDAAFFRAIHPRDTCALQVTSPDAVTRTLDLRFVAGGDVESDPMAFGFYAPYALEFVVARPFWRGDEVRYAFLGTPPAPLFPGPPFAINLSSSVASAVVRNPGDEPAYPTYTVTGPATDWRVGLDGAGVSSNTPLLAGQSVTIDMDPTRLEVFDQSGADVYETLDEDAFSNIPAGDEVPLDLAINGITPASRVEVAFTPLYRRAW